MRAGGLPLAQKIAACERAFEAEGVPIVFRIPSITPECGLDAALAARGYRKVDKTSIRLLDLAGFTLQPLGQVELEAHLTLDWLAAFARFDGMTPVECETHRAIVAATRHPTMFGAIRDGGAVVSVAAAVLQDGFVYFNSVATDPAKRRRGLSWAVMVALLDWAKRHGAAYAHLPVVKTNTPAIALYNRLGFRAELYRYHYRARPD
jgi:ribosomal protein S18 acetylase RimI-like enzyme